MSCRFKIASQTRGAFKRHIGKEMIIIFIGNALIETGEWQNGNHNASRMDVWGKKKMGTNIRVDTEGNY
jgi:hypothetical protein